MAGLRATNFGSMLSRCGGGGERRRGRRRMREGGQREDARALARPRGGPRRQRWERSYPWVPRRKMEKRLPGAGGSARRYAKEGLIQSGFAGLSPRSANG